MSFSSSNGNDLKRKRTSSPQPSSSSSSNYSNGISSSSVKVPTDLNPNYKPLPQLSNGLGNSHKRAAPLDANTEALGFMRKSKVTGGHKVYSGSKR